MMRTGRIVVRNLGKKTYREAVNAQNAVLSEIRAARRSEELFPNFPSGRKIDGHLLLMEQFPAPYVIRSAEYMNKGMTVTDMRPVFDKEPPREKAVETQAKHGEVCFHGPGQLVIYPILDLTKFQKDVSWYTSSLCRAIMSTLSAFNFTSYTPDETGIWIGKRRIATLGLQVSDWFTTHGAAINVVNDISAWRNFPIRSVDDPKDTRGLTSISKELGKVVRLDEVMPLFLSEFAEIFDRELILGNEKTVQPAKFMKKVKSMEELHTRLMQRV